MLSARIRGVPEDFRVEELPTIHYILAVMGGPIRVAPYATFGSQELAAISGQVDWAATEPEWAHFVDQAEEAISREHTLWRASRT